jgi:hypothetical protein
VLPSPFSLQILTRFEQQYDMVSKVKSHLHFQKGEVYEITLYNHFIAIKLLRTSSSFVGGRPVWEALGQEFDSLPPHVEKKNPLACPHQKKISSTVHTKAQV